MNVLVTGATGFLGRALCKRLEGRGDAVTRVSTATADLTDPAALAPYRDAKYERIYHLAAWTRAGDFCLHHQGQQWLINQQINTSVLRWWADHQQGAMMVAVGTSCAYSPDYPLSEDAYLLGMPTPDLFSYAMTKRMLHVGMVSLHAQFGLRYLNLVPATLYGPDYHVDGRQMHFIFDLITKIVRGKVCGEPVVLWGDGHQKRELLYINDFVDALVELPEFHRNDIVNVAPGIEYSIRDYAGMICQEVGYDFSNIHFDEARYVGVRSKCLSNAKLRELAPRLKMTPLDEGLRKTIDWVQRNASPMVTRDSSG